MQRIAGPAIFRSLEGGIRSQVGAYVARIVSGDRQVRRSHCEVRDRRYSLPSIPSGACVKAEKCLDVSGSTDGTNESK